MTRRRMIKATLAAMAGAALPIPATSRIDEVGRLEGVRFMWAPLHPHRLRCVTCGAHVNTSDWWCPRCQEKKEELF